MNRNHLLLAALVAAGAMLVPTGAVPYDAFGSDSPSGMANVELSPADGSHGDYAVLNEDGEIELLLSEENPYIDHDGIPGDSESTIPRVFNITYTGPASVQVWLTDGTDAIRFFYGDEHSNSIEGEHNRVALDSGETVSVGLWIDSSDGDEVEGTDSFDVHARLPERGGSGVNDDDDSTDDTQATSTPPETRQPTSTIEPSDRDDGGEDDTDDELTEQNTPTPTQAPATTTTGSQPETTTSAIGDTTPSSTVAKSGGQVARTTGTATTISKTPTTRPASDDGFSSSSGAGRVPVELGGGSLVRMVAVAVGTGVLVVALAGFRRFRNPSGG